MAEYTTNKRNSVPMAELARIIGKSQPTISQSLSLNRLPREIRDECRQDPTVPKNVLVEIARKKQERSMLTKFRQYRDLQAKAAAKDAGAPAQRKRTKAETLTEGIGLMISQVGFCNRWLPRAVQHGRSTSTT